MYARIIDGRVAEVTEEMPVLGVAECALVVEVDAGVRPGKIPGLGNG